MFTLRGKTEKNSGFSQLLIKVAYVTAMIIHLFTDLESIARVKTRETKLLPLPHFFIICILIGKGELFSSPFIAPDGNIYIGSGEGEVLALRQADGSLVWSFKTESSVWSSPRLDKNGVLYIGGIDTYLYALRSENGHLVWKYKTDGPVVGTPLITREHAVEQA